MSIENVLRDYVATAAPAKKPVKKHPLQKQFERDIGKQTGKKISVSTRGPKEKKEAEARRAARFKKTEQDSKKTLERNRAESKKKQAAKVNPRTQALKDKYKDIAKQMLKLSQEKAKVRAALEKLGVKFRGRKAGGA